MKFRLISKNADAIALLYRLWKEGADVSFYVKEKRAKPTYKNMLPQVDRWNEGLTKGTIVLFDMVGLGSVAESLKKSGHKVYGGGVLNDRLELDRSFGMKVAKMAGVKVPEFVKFTSFDKAIKFIKEKGSRWVFKPAGNKPTSKTYVSRDADDMTEMLEYFKSSWQGSVDFILQEYIEGVEISSEMWFADGEPIANSFNSTIEQKKFMEGDKGPNTGCQSSVVWFWKKENPKIYKHTIRKVAPFLKRFKYSGALDMNCIVAAKDKLPYFLEFTARFGYSAIYALCEGLGRPVSEFLADLVQKGSETKLLPSYNWLGAVRVSVPPFPSETQAQENIPVQGVGSTDHVWLLDVKHEKEKIVTAGVDGVVCEVTGKDSTLDGLDKQIYSRIKKLRIPDMQYRGDAVSDAKNKIDTLKSWGYF